MVDEQIIARGIRDERLIAAMRAVPRAAFVPEGLRDAAYDDRALPIEAGQTISQPYIVALMTRALEIRPTDRVLEVGAGSGYAAAILGRLAAEVYAVERHEELVALAAERMRTLGYSNVYIRQAADGLGLPEHAPFDAISVAAGAPRIAGSLCRQLAIGGRLVMPVGASRVDQQLVRVRRTGEDAYTEERLGSVHFVPLIGREAWPGGDAPDTP